MNLKRIGILAYAACFFAVVAFPLSAQQYEIVDLGTLGGARSGVHSINENGIISGWATLPSGEMHAVIWDASGIVDLGVPPGFISSVAVAANTSGQVAAYAEGDSQSYQGFLWEDGSWTPIGVLPGFSDSIARDIDAAGRIVGSSFVPGGEGRAFMWNAGALTDLGTLGGSSSATGINDVGQVSGVSTAYLPGGDRQPRGFLWENGQMTALDPLPGDFRSAAADINEVGQVCGSSTNSGSPPYFLSVESAVLWANGTVIDLGSVPGYGLNSASAVNNHGQVVGTGEHSHTNPLNKAFIWQGGVIQNLNDLVAGGTEWDLKWARDINDAGQIVGSGRASPDDQYYRAFLLEPLVPCNVDSECDDGFFCNGVEECVADVCRRGSNPCPGLVCDEELSLCEPPTCNFDFTCDLGENCNSCPDDCVSHDGAQSCGDGICQPGNGEDCLSCAADCCGQQKGNPRNRFCCGADVGCTDTRCNADTWVCDDTQPASYCCGDGACDSGESPCNCPVDCGPQYVFTETSCTDGVDNDCDSLVDEDDSDCCAQKGDGCYSDGDCCSGNCKKSSKFPYLGTCR
jgi:probable HAF family extracellular repeat protein